LTTSSPNDEKSDASIEGDILTDMCKKHYFSV
jgi:hypothetical protein